MLLPCGRWNSHFFVYNVMADVIAQWFKEHLKAPSPIYDHQNITGHNVTLDNFSILGRED